MIAALAVARAQWTGCRAHLSQILLLGGGGKSCHVDATQQLLGPARTAQQQRAPAAARSGAMEDLSVPSEETSFVTEDVTALTKEVTRARYRPHPAATVGATIAAPHRCAGGGQRAGPVRVPAQQGAAVDADGH